MSFPGERTLTLNNEMDTTWLIQRLNKPQNFDNPFSFGGGLRNGGLSDNAMSLIRNIFSFDYMGAAEFEFGAVPQALKFIAEQATNNNLIASVIEVGKDEIVYYISPKEYATEVVNRIQLLRQDKIRLKESCGLNYYFDEFFGKPFRTDNVGWMELNNGYFFFVDKSMFENTCKLFGISEY
jgi:hypothetical protein